MRKITCADNKNANLTNECHNLHYIHIQEKDDSVNSVYTCEGTETVFVILYQHVSNSLEKLQTDNDYLSCAFIPCIICLQATQDKYTAQL